MKYYTFYDTNILGDCNEEYDITSDDYIELLKICFKYSASFSFMITKNDSLTIKESLPNELEKYRIYADDYVLNNYNRYMDLKRNIHCYQACPETFDLILKINDSIFKWINGWGNKKPEDLAFFREDGSIFFSSIVHHGECSIYPRDNEDISSVLSSGNWYLKTDNK